MVRAFDQNLGSDIGGPPISLGDRCASALKELSEPWVRGDKIKAAIDRASRRVGLPYWRAFDIWYGKARRIEQYELDAIDEALDKKRREAARNELHELRTAVLRLEARLSQIDPDFNRPSIDAARDMVREISGGRRTNGGAVAGRR